jgi:hypothetical protein
MFFVANTFLNMQILLVLAPLVKKQLRLQQLLGYDEKHYILLILVLPIASIAD